jgi:hypothetical protein
MLMVIVILALVRLMGGCAPTHLVVTEDPQLIGIRAGFVNLLRLVSSQGKRVCYPGLPCLLGSPLRARDLGPTLESIPHLLTVRGR